MSALHSSSVVYAAVTLFSADQAMSGYKAVVFGRVLLEQIYIGEGFASMKDFAAQRLSVRASGTFDLLSRAGKAAWDAFPQECAQIVELASIGEHPVSGAYPANFPSTKTLAAMSAALRRVPQRREEIVARVRSGEWHETELLELGRTPKPATKAQPASRVVKSVTKSVTKAIRELDAEGRRQLVETLRPLLQDISTTASEVPPPAIDPQPISLPTVRTPSPEDSSPIGGSSTHTPVWVSEPPPPDVPDSYGSSEAPAPVEAVAEPPLEAPPSPPISRTPVTEPPTAHHSRVPSPPPMGELTEQEKASMEMFKAAHPELFTPDFLERLATACSPAEVEHAAE